MLIGSALIFALVMALFALAILKPQAMARISARNWIIWGGLGLPAVVLPPLVIWALVAGERILPIPEQDVPRIEVISYMWGFTFRYPDHGGGESENILHLPQGTPVDLHISSLDVIHSFWVPQLGGKMDAIPGKINVLRLQADRAGVYRGLCAEFCGTGHTGMRFDVMVHEDEAALQAAIGEGGAAQ